ncbi:MAG: baseplate J/gp47 family protein [Candidatus Blackburnbacteria bacterium]|nr:baseplate J/gp47 family protein [Candidatus Blackburnbacteria bacterium]
MDLGIFKKQQEIEHLWSLVVARNWVEAGIWRVIGEKVEVVAQGGAASWQEDNPDTLMIAADSSLSAAAAILAEDVTEPTRVVFGLLPSWIEKGGIKKERLEILKKLCKELELKPAGFVVIPEAIAHFQKAKEGALLNALLVGLAEDFIDLSFIQAGKILGTVEVARSISLGQDIAEGLARLPVVPQYPSRILLYDHRAGNLDEARQNLINVEWRDLKVTFLHTPKVEILPEDVGISAVSLAGGIEVAQARTVEFPGKEEGEEVKTGVESEALGGEPEKELEEVSIEELGFIKGSDAAQQEVKNPAYAPPADGASVGRQKEESLKREGEEAAEEEVEETEKEPVPPKVSRGLPSLPKLSLPTKTWAFSPPSLSFGSGAFRFAGIFAVVFFFLLALGGVLYWYLPKAQITVYVAPKTLEKSVEFTADPQVSVISQADKTVPARKLETSVSGEKTGRASGTKTVGDRAKGKVVIYNAGGSTTLKSGVVFTGPNSLKFTLDSDTPVASGSSSANPSRTTVSVTASDIGAQYNLVSGTEFSVGNFAKSALSAKNEEVLSGGTSREVSAVSKEDAATLEKELSEELLQKGAGSIGASLKKEDVLIEGSALLEPTSKTFSNKVGEETTTLKLSIEGKVIAFVMPADALNALIKAALESDIPSGFVLRQDQVEVSYKRKEQEERKEKKETVKEQNIFIAEVKANLLPKVDTDQISRAVAGKYQNVAKDYLAKIPGFTRAEVDFSIRLPGKLETLPRIPKNIKVEVIAER